MLGVKNLNIQRSPKKAAQTKCAWRSSVVTILKAKSVAWLVAFLFFLHLRPAKRKVFDDAVFCLRFEAKRAF